jgi:hypothetical protein
MPIDFDTIVVKKGTENARQAKRMFAFKINPTKIADVNIYEGERTIIETPMILGANKNNWFSFDSKIELPLLVSILKFPSLNEPIKQNNEAVRSNVTGYFTAGITNMPFNFYGSDGTQSGS